MNSITRYSPAEWSHNWDVVPSVSGTYVRYSDHLAILAEIARERDAARAECAAWRKFWRAFKAEGYKFLSPIRSKAYAEANRAVYEAREASDALTPTTGGQGEGGKQ